MTHEVLHHWLLEMPDVNVQQPEREMPVAERILVWVLEGILTYIRLVHH